MIGDLETVKDRVGYLLEKFPELRDDDRKLWLSYLKQFHDLDRVLRDAEDPYAAFRKVMLSDSMVMPESIRRTRQKYQQDGMYQGEGREEKMQESKRVREWIKFTESRIL